MLFANVFQDLADELSGLFQGLINALWSLVQNLLSLINQLWAWLFDTLRTLGDHMITWLLNTLSTYVPGVNVATWSSTLAGINYVFPLSESLVLATALFSLWVTVLLYRLVKSWIPTVAS